MAAPGQEMQRLPGPWRTLPRRARLLVLLALALLWGPSTAQASCGDYVHFDVNASHQDEARPDLPVSPLPCQGPHCSRNEPLPLVPSPAPRLTSEQVLPPAAT